MVWIQGLRKGGLILTGRRPLARPLRDPPQDHFGTKN
jgi:hypothetical protein